MTYRNAKNLHNEDEVTLKKTKKSLCVVTVRTEEKMFS